MTDKKGLDNGIKKKEKIIAQIFAYIKYIIYLCNVKLKNIIDMANKYNRIIDSINGTIGIKHCYDTEYGAYNDVYLDDKYVCEADMECTDKEIEDLVEEALFKVDVNSDYPF